MKQSYPGAIKPTLEISNQKAEVHTVNVYQNPDLICSFANSPSNLPTTHIIMTMSALVPNRTSNHVDSRTPDELPIRVPCYYNFFCLDSKLISKGNPQSRID